MAALTRTHTHGHAISPFIFVLFTQELVTNSAGHVTHLTMSLFFQVDCCNLNNIDEVSLGGKWKIACFLDFRKDIVKLFA